MAVESQADDWANLWTELGTYLSSLEGLDIPPPAPLLVKSLREGAKSFPASTGLGGDVISPRALDRFSDQMLESLCHLLRALEVIGDWPTTLRQVLASGPRPLQDVLRLGRQLLATLAIAETKRIVHRDVKPENVMLDRSGDFWLLDFGLARLLDMDSLTATHLPFGVGTLGYSAPEQFRNQKRLIDARADLFSLGVLLYECVVGLNPFRHGARDDLEILSRVEQMRLPRLNLPEDATGAFGDFVAALTQKHRTQRPRTVSEAAVWLSEIEAANRRS